MAALDYFRILGVKPTSTVEEVRRRYRLLARRYHPDHNPDDPEASSRFRQVVDAFEAVMAAKAQARTRPRRRRNAAQYRPARFSGKGHLFEEYFGILQEDFSEAWSAGADFRYDLEISLVEAIKGTDTTIAVDHHPSCRQCLGTGLAVGTYYQECPDCRGRGRRFGGPGLLRFGPVCERCRGLGKIVAEPCGHCGGQGSCSHTKEHHLRIPPGTRDGARFHLRGEGGEGFQNGPPGNLLVVIHVAPHEVFTWAGNDIYCRIEVSMAEASLGGAVRIPTLDGYQTVNLPKGAQSGWTFRLRGAGVPGTPQQAPGDQVNVIIVNTPHNLDPQPRPQVGELGRLEREHLDRAGHE